MGNRGSWVVDDVDGDGDNDNDCRHEIPSSSPPFPSHNPPSKLDLKLEQLSSNPEPRG